MARLLLRALAAVAAGVAAIGCAIAATAFLIDALYLYLTAVPVSPAVAALIVGLVLLGLAGLIMLAAFWIVSRRKPAGPPALEADRLGDSLGAAAGELGRSAAREAAAAAQAHPYGATSFAFLVGLAFGSNPEMREILKAALTASQAGMGPNRR